MSKRFRIALSFAGEKRDFVHGVAEILAARFGEERILYDKYHQAEFARDKLSVYLPNLYRTDADLIVTVICKEYNQKLWTGLEWEAVRKLLNEQKESSVMLCRFNYEEGEELEGHAGYIDLDNMQPEAAVARVLERLAVNEDRPKDYYAPLAEWPGVPNLDWLMADHTKAREEFGRLISLASKYRYLPISGESETGKSHLSKQFLSNARRIDLRCGRFDFKGATDMDEEIKNFANDLHVPVPDASSFSARLGEIFTALKAYRRPTLLVFDTFEQSGDGANWIKDTLLRNLRNQSWLRVTIVGKEVPGPDGGDWEAVSTKEVVLKRPTAEDWYELGKRKKPPMKLKFVKELYRECDGSPSLLAAVCTPK